MSVSKLLCGAFAGAGLFFTSSLAMGAPIPSSGTANVDGDFAEWDLTEDLFASMYRAGRDDKPIETFLYLRYDSATQYLYALVLPDTDVTILQENDDAFIKLGNSTKLVDGNSGDDGVPPDFAWINPTGSTAGGWEASVQLAPGTYSNFNVHTQVFSDDEEQTSAVLDRSIPLELVNNPDEPEDPQDPVTTVPEPASAGLLMLGLGALVARRRRHHAGN